MTKYVLVIFLLFLNSCQNQKNEYDSKMLELMASASNGDSAAALDAYDYCTSELKLYPGDLDISDFAGACGGMLALAIENALANGDPTEIKRILEYVQLGNGDSKKRMKFYLAVAKMTIAKRCAGNDRPEGCNNEKLMKNFALQ